MDWTECAVVETVPGKMGGQPVIKGTRLRPQDLIVNREQGFDWIIENYGGVTREQIQTVFDFHDRHQRASVAHPAACSEGVRGACVRFCWAAKSVRGSIAQGEETGYRNLSHNVYYGNLFLSKTENLSIPALF